jgi:hypothetical protein
MLQAQKRLFSPLSNNSDDELINAQHAHANHDYSPILPQRVSVISPSPHDQIATNDSFCINNASLSQQELSEILFASVRNQKVQASPNGAVVIQPPSF